MQVLIPQQLKILNDTVPENEAPLWDKAVAYTKGQSVIYDHYVYKAVDAAAAGVVPVDNCDADGCRGAQYPSPTNMPASIFTTGRRPRPTELRLSQYKSRIRCLQQVLLCSICKRRV